MDAKFSDFTRTLGLRWLSLYSFKPRVLLDHGFYQVAGPGSPMVVNIGLLLGQGPFYV